MLIMLLQPNPTVGDFSGNARALARLAGKAVKESEAVLASDTQNGPKGGFKALAVTPASALCGTPWMPLSMVGGFFERLDGSLALLKKELAAIPAFADGMAAMLVSMPSETSDCNRLFLLHGDDGLEVSTDDSGLVKLPGLTLYMPGMSNGEIPVSLQGVEAVLWDDPIAFSWGASEINEDTLWGFARELELPVLSVNQAGATDSTVFAGQSTVFIPAEGENLEDGLLARAGSFTEDAVVIELAGSQTRLVSGRVHAQPCFEEAMFRGGVTGIRDYFGKSGLKNAVVGLSGGIDSALVLCMAVEALGADRVRALLMPSPWSSEHSVEDARALAENQFVGYQVAPIGDVMKAFDGVLNPLLDAFPKQEGDLGPENLQARIRGVMLMAFANRLQGGVLGTGNKSEAAVGYCTLYGDTVGAIEPISDIYKTDVYRIARWYNDFKGSQVIPERIFTKAPSAELRPGQKDQDSLPPYNVLDAILRAILDDGADPATLTVEGADQATVAMVTRLIGRAEFKRHQSPPVIALTESAFGETWALPIAAKNWPE